jgi:hypothetical protein
MSEERSEFLLKIGRCQRDCASAELDGKSS